MAETRPLDFDLSAPEPSTLPLYRQLGLINGLLIGSAMGLGAWGAEALKVTRLDIPLYLPSLLLGFAAVMFLGGMTGWLTARVARAMLTVLLWVLTAILSMLIIGYMPYHGRTFIAWLADPRFWGKAIYPYTLGGTTSGLILGGLLVILVLGILGLLQGYRLDNMMAEAGRRQTLTGRVWLSLAVPLPIVFLASLVTQNVIANPSATAVELTHRAIAGAQGFEGDYLDLGKVDGVNYVALRGLEGRLEGPFTLAVTEIDSSMGIVIVAANFENGNWVYCRSINDQLIYCYDAARAYDLTLHSLLTGEPVPETCLECDPGAAGAWGDWFAARIEGLGVAPRIERQAQQGSQILFRITGESGLVIECWFEGISPVKLTSCHEITP